MKIFLIVLLLGLMILGMLFLVSLNIPDKQNHKLLLELMILEMICLLNLSTLTKKNDFHAIGKTTASNYNVVINVVFTRFFI